MQFGHIKSAIFSQFAIKSLFRKKLCYLKFKLPLVCAMFGSNVLKTYYAMLIKANKSLQSPSKEFSVI